MSDRGRRRSRLVSLAAGLALLLGALPPGTGIGGAGVALAQAGDEICPGNAGGFPLKTTSAWPSTTDLSSVSCAYDNTHKPRNQTHFSAEVFWHDVAAVEADEAEMDTRFCDRGEAGDAARLFYEGPTHAWDLSRIGDRRVYTTYAWGRKDKKAAARKLAQQLLRAVESSATACPGARSSGTDRDGSTTIAGAAGTTEIVLSGDRLRGLRRAGGIGAVIALAEDEQYGLVLTDAAGNPVATDDVLGARGRVVDMGVSLVGEDGVEVVSVTVELLEDATEPHMPEPDATETDPTDEVEPGPEPDTVDPEPDTVDPEPDTVDPEPADGPIEAIAARVRTELDAIAERGRGSVIVEAGEIGRAGTVAPGLVAAVRPREGKIEVALISEKFPKVFVYPTIDRDTGEVTVATKVEPPGDFGFVEIPVDPSLLPGVGTRLDRGLQVLNAELRRRGVRPTGIVITEAGVLVELEAAS